MAADIVKTAQNAISAAHDQQRFPGELGGEVVERVRDLIAPANDLPRFPKKVSTFTLQECWIEINIGGKRPGGCDRVVDFEAWMAR
jgi:hypothetical protein